MTTPSEITIDSDALLILLPFLCAPTQEWSTDMILRCVDRPRDVIADRLSYLAACGYIAIHSGRTSNSTIPRYHLKAWATGAALLDPRLKDVLQCGLNATIEHVIVITAVESMMSRRRTDFSTTLMIRIKETTI